MLRWYDRHARALPWRAAPGVRPDPYRVWLSEIMLQQTRVAAVIPYFAAFTARWPAVGDLAAAHVDEVLAAWAGLGYYTRARNLHACARAVVERFHGRFPATAAELRTLPGIGDYTGAAIAAIAFDQRESAVDGNVLRVMARRYSVAAPLPGVRGELAELAAALVPATRPGDYAQAVMDLGATICTPRNPQCGVCPWATDCVARTVGNQAELPRRAAKAVRPKRYGVAFVLTRTDGAVLLRRRPPTGLLGGMLEVPGTPWRAKPWDGTEALEHAPAKARWRTVDGIVRHVFTHFTLELTVLTARTVRPGNDGLWTEDPLAAGLPTVMRKVVELAGGTV